MKYTLSVLSVISLILPHTLQATEIVAHRGYSAKAPENTVAAFKAAWEVGTDACELDLYLTKDGKIAVIHDKDTKRTTGVANVVAETALADLKKLDAGSWKGSEYKGVPIPTLAEALATLPHAPNKRFFLEVKSGTEVVPVLAKELESYKSRAAQLCIIAFNRDVARESKKALPWLKVFRLSSGKSKGEPVDLTKLINDTKEDGLDGLDLGKDFPWSEQMVKQIRDAKMELYVWTLTKSEEVKRMAGLKVDGITADDPVMAREALQK